MDRLWKEVRALFKEWDAVYQRYKSTLKELDQIQWECVRSRLLKRLRDSLFLQLSDLRTEISKKPLCYLHFDVAIRAATGLPADVSGLIATYAWKHHSYKNSPLMIPRRGYRPVFLQCPCWCDWTLPERPKYEVEVKFHTDMVIHWRCLGQEDLFLNPKDIRKMHEDAVDLYRFIELSRPYLCDKSKIEDAKALTSEFSLWPSRSSPIKQKLAYGLNTAGFQPLLDELAMY